MSTTPSNGKVLWWLVGILSTLFTGGAGAWMSSMHTLSRIHGEKIAVMESQIAEQRYQLERMDQKLDRLLEQKGKQ